MRSLKRGLFSVFNGVLVDYKIASNLSYAWNFGSLAGVCLVLQIVTGLFLAMHYVPNVEYAFQSVEHIMRDVEFGWFLRYGHANGASMFFIVLYIHMFRGIYYGSYKDQKMTWFSGVTIFLFTIITAFLGYVLPWGQMSYWGATVITNLVSAVPMVGQDLVHWLWGGFSVNNATLNRFFVFHFILPIVIAFVAMIHLLTLHQTKSSNPDCLNTVSGDISFHPYFISKDLFGIVVFFIILIGLICFYPNLLGHPDNYEPANPLVTPPHIVPEWYFLPFYAILRSIASKILGVLAMVASIAILYLLPLLDGFVLKASTRSYHQVLFWILPVCFLILGWIGGCPIEEPFYQIGQVAAIVYFSYFLIVLPLLSIYNRNEFLFYYSVKWNTLNVKK